MLYNKNEKIMKKVQVLKSVEGGSYTKVVLEERLFNALIELDVFNTTFNYLMVSNLLNDELTNKMKIIYSETLSIIKEYGLDKYDIRAHYKFNEAKRLLE